MMLNPTQVYDQKTKTALGAQNPCYLRQAKKAQPALYDGDELLKPHHVPVIVPSSEEELELAEATRNKLHVKMNDSACVEKRVNITPPNYSKENFMATFTPQTQLTPEQVFWSLDLAKRKAEELKANALPLPILPPATVFSDMHDAFTIAQKRIADLESKNFNLRNKIQNDDHDSMIKHFSKLEVEHFNLQLKKLNEQIQSRGNTIHELKEKISRLTEKNSDADPTLDLKALVSQNKDLTVKLNAFHDLNERFKAENAKVMQHYKELYDSIKITHAKTTDQNNSLLSEIENLKAQLKDNSKCVTIPDSKPKVLALGRYPIDVEPIPPRLKKNREVHLHYIKHLKENVKTLREIVEEAKVKKPLDTSLNASTNSLWKKRVTFVEPCETSTHSTPPQVEHQKINSTNAPGIPSTGVKGHYWKPTGRTLPLGAQCPLNRKTIPKIVPVKIWKPTGRLIPLKGQCPLTRPTALTSDIVLTDLQAHHTPVVQTILWYLDSGCSKHMTGDRSRLRNFMKKFIRTVRFGNDHFGAIMGYGDYVIEVAFRKHTCFVRDLDGVDLIKGNRGTNLYTISVEDMMRSSPICLLSKASKNKSWLWHHHLNHLNFGTLNDLARKELVRSLPRLKFEKDHLVINGKKYILVIVDDYSRFTWVKFLRTKDETPAFVINLLKQLQVGLNKTVKFVLTDNGTEFVNKALTDYYESVGITHEKTVPRTPTSRMALLNEGIALLLKLSIRLIFSKLPISFGQRLWPLPITPKTLTEQTAPVHSSPGPAPNLLTPGPISSGLVPNPPPAAPYVPPTNKELEILFQPMFYEYFESSTVDRLVPPAPAAQAPVNPTGPLVSIPIDQEAPSGINPFATADPEPFVNVFAPDHNSEALSSRVIARTESNQTTQPHEHLQKWTTSHPIDNIIGNPSSTNRNHSEHLATELLWCFLQFSNGPMSNRKTFKFDVTRRLLVFSSHARMNPIEFNRLDVMGTVPLQLCNDYCSQVDL
ncbi:retrovirus-related pol polyprotein from transposon TNT 1-94 [Tanacetum coccineum]